MIRTLLLCALQMPLHAQMPRTISYQGVATDGAGTPIGNGNHILTLRLYDTPTDGTPLWSEVHTTTTTAGLFSVILGSLNSFGSLGFDRPYFLGVAVDAGEELKPRTPLTSAPYALNGGVTTLNGTSGALTLQGGGGTTVNRSGTTITISSSGGGGGGSGVQGVQSSDGIVSVANSNGPVVSLGVNAGSITGGHIADGTISRSDLASGVLPTTLPPSGGAGGDLSGSYPSPVVSKVQGRSVSSAVPAVGQVLKWSGSAWEPGSGGGLALPYNDSATSGGTLFRIGNKGTGTGLEVWRGAVLFSDTFGVTPAVGAGTRLMWIPQKGALRAGAVTGSQWNDSLIGLNSVAMGKNTTASGGGATAIGASTTASGFVSTAMGNGTVASGFSSTAMGASNTASGNTSTAMGNANTASGNTSLAMGLLTTASGRASTAMGSSTTASGEAATAMGSSTNGSGGFSTAMGFNTTASGNTSTAMGGNSIASGDISMAMGSSTVASGLVSTAMGNRTIASGSVSTAMGNQTTASGTASTAMGDSTVASGSYSTAAGWRASTNFQEGSFIYGDRSSNTVMNSTGANRFEVRAQRFWFGSGATVSYPATAAFIGTSTGAYLSNSGTWTNNSDSTKKTDIHTVDRRKVLESVARLPVQSWRYRTDSSDVYHIGPMAQAFHGAFGLNGGDSTHIATVDADGVALAAIGGLKEMLDERIEVLQQENAELRALGGSGEDGRRRPAFQAIRQ